MIGIGTAILGAGLLGAGASIASSLSNRSAVESSNRHNERLSWEQWHTTNRYNHPKEQMRRFREAGLNPNLIYGQMANVPPPAFVRSTPVPGIDIGMDKVANAIKDYSTFDLQRASTEHNMLMSEAGLELQKQRMNADLDLKNRELNLQESLLPYKIDQIKTDNEMNKFTMRNLLNPPKTGSLGEQVEEIVNHPHFSKLPWYSELYGHVTKAGKEFLESNFNPANWFNYKSAPVYKRYNYYR